MVLAHNFNSNDRTQDVKISQNVSFDTMLLNECTLQGLKASGFYKPSPIQLHGIPLGKCGFDLLLEAKSGTGKTAVFTVIALEKINLNNGLQAIMLAPTREIAAQICDVIRQIGSQYPGLTVETVMGGLPVKDDIEKLKKKVHILVGSPGRLHHLIHDKHVDTSRVRLVVLDEADKLMEKSFRSDVDYIFSALPQQKQIIFSSATFPEDSKAFINQYVQVHQHICPDSNSVLLGISQKVTFVSHNTNIVRQTLHRFEELLNILSKKEFKQCLIFCNYQARVTELYKMLKKAKWPAEKLYGQQEQTDRLEALKTLQEYKCRILIATDLAARGLDSSHVDLVVNFEPPYEWQTYLHRIGRAGRFGSYGLAVTILNNQEEKQFKELLKSLQFQLDICHFWSDAQFVYSDDPTTSKTPEIAADNIEKTLCNNESTADYDDDNEELCSLLTYESPQYEIESFDQLCLSFKEATDKVESFTDILESFQRTHIEETNNSTNTECLNESNIINNYQDHIEHDLNPLLATQNKEQSKPLLDEQIILEPEIIEGSEFDNCIEQNITTSNYRKKNGYKNNYETARVLDKINKKYNCEPRPTKSKDYEKDQTSDESDDDDDSESGNQMSYNLNRSHSNYENNSSDIRYNYGNPIKHEEHSNRRYHSNRGYPLCYINWYNYLKFRTQQIEMFVYINEMSKL